MELGKRVGLILTRMMSKRKFPEPPAPPEEPPKERNLKRKRFSVRRNPRWRRH